MVIPRQGDIIEIDVPESGKSKRCRIMVISKSLYNEVTGLCLAVVILNKKKILPTEVEITKNTVILADQMKSIDYNVRQASFISTINAQISNRVLRIIEKIIF
jgi:mRNA interferase MazF